SIGVFFTLMILGLAASLPHTLTTGLENQGVPATVAQQIGNLPPVGSLFAAFLGFNPLAELLGPSGVLGHLPAANAATLAGKEFFPNLISGPFHQGLVVVFITAAVMSVVSAAASLVDDRKPGNGGGAAAPDRPIGASAADAVPDAPSDEVLRVSP